jgi:hypothetical protein
MSDILNLRPENEGFVMIAIPVQIHIEKQRLQ